MYITSASDENQFRVFKLIPVEQVSIQQNTKQVFKDPFKAKQSSNQLFSKNSNIKYHAVDIEIAVRLVTLGCEDIVDGNSTHSYSVMAKNDSSYIRLSLADVAKMKSWPEIWE